MRGYSYDVLLVSLSSNVLVTFSCVIKTENCVCATATASNVALPLVPHLLRRCLLFVVQVLGVGECHVSYVANAAQRHLERRFC